MLLTKKLSLLGSSVLALVLSACARVPEGLAEYKQHIAIPDSPDAPQIHKEDGAVINSEGIDYGKTFRTYLNPDIDPYQRINRRAFYFNYDILDRYILRPLAVANRKYVSPDLQQALVTAYYHLEEPIHLFSNVASGQAKQAGINTWRLFVNSVFGLGVFDFAREAGLYSNQNSFNFLLASYGVPTGSYLHVPGYGPSYTRSFIATVLAQNAAQAGLYAYLAPSLNPLLLPLQAYWIVNTRSDLIDKEGLLVGAPDPYQVVRFAYSSYVNFNQSKATGTAVPSQTDPGFDPSLLDLLN